jgi:hypothetical protein
MRSLFRNARNLYYANVLDTLPIQDAYGNDTLEVQKTYGAPALLRCNISANAGREAVEIFGEHTAYSRIISMTGHCPLEEGSRIWFGVEPTEPNNYIVVRVADSKNSYLVALQEVSKRG